MTVCGMPGLAGMRGSTSYSYAMVCRMARFGLRCVCALSVQWLWCATVAVSQAGMLSSFPGWADDHHGAVQPAAMLTSDGPANPAPTERSGKRSCVRARLNVLLPAGFDVKFTPVSTACMMGFTTAATPCSRKRRCASNHHIPECARRRMHTAGRHPPRT